MLNALAEELFNPLPNTISHLEITKNARESLDGRQWRESVSRVGGGSKNVQATVGKKRGEYKYSLTPHTNGTDKSQNFCNRTHSFYAGQNK